jgi:hypothetical protein
MSGRSTQEFVLGEAAAHAQKHLDRGDVPLAAGEDELGDVLGDRIVQGQPALVAGDQHGTGDEALRHRRDREDHIRVGTAVELVDRSETSRVRQPVLVGDAIYQSTRVPGRRVLAEQSVKLLVEGTWSTSWDICQPTPTRTGLRFDRVRSLRRNIAATDATEKQRWPSHEEEMFAAD